jgi:hypothetical protein
MYSVRNTAARDAASQLHLLQRHTSLRPRHFLHVTDDANGRPLPSTALTTIWSFQSHCTSSFLVGQTSHLQRTRTQSVCGYLLDSMFWANWDNSANLFLCSRLQKGRHFPSVVLALQCLQLCRKTATLRWGHVSRYDKITAYYRGLFHRNRIVELPFWFTFALQWAWRSYSNTCILLQMRICCHNANCIRCITQHRTANNFWLRTFKYSLYRWVFQISHEY